MKYFSTFSGIGGFELGIKQAYEDTKSLQSKQNCDTINIWKKNVQNVGLKNHSQTSIIQPQTQCGARFVREKMQEIEPEETQKSIGKQVENVEKKIEKNIIEKEENIMQNEDNEFLKCMEENVPVVEKQKKNSSPLNTNEEMDIKTERNMERDICTNSHSKKIINQNTKSCATTATMQKEDMESVPICVGFSEIDKYATQIYEKHFPTHTNFGDITKIVADELPDFDLLVGGFPCQAFSIAGKREGFKDTRGTLFFDLARILQAKKPSYFIFENVKGLLNHDKGNTFATILTAITELGYDCQWQVLNSKNFGVPQNRERVFIVGNLRGTRRPEVFPIGGNAEQTTGEHKKRKINVIGTTVGKGEGTNSRHWVHSTDGIIGAINATEYKQPKQIVQPGLTPDRVNKRQNGRRMKENGEPSFTLTGQDKHGIYDGAKIRRLTPIECERLQGFPDDFTKFGINEKGEEVLISDSQRYKMCGNAVTVNVVREVVKRLL